MGLVFLTGGARSGKSSMAQRWALSSGRPVTVVVTAEAGDDEMVERIARHRADRPAGWCTVEAPLGLTAAIAVVPDDHAVIIDCLSIWIANLVIADIDEASIVEQAGTLVDVCRARAATVVVTNEVGSGIVPDNELARRYRDILGRANAIVAAAADEAFVVVAGRCVPLAPSPW